MTESREVICCSNSIPKSKIDISKADAELSGIRNTLDALRAEYRTAEAELRDAEQGAEYYRRVFQRQRQQLSVALHHAQNTKKRSAI